MYTIGEFSRINRITPKTLRHYDRIDLLKPQKTDDWTGYRYYGTDQLPAIRRILVLRDLGFGLEEIRRLLTGEESEERSLKRREAELKTEMAEDRRRLKRIRVELKNLGGEKMTNSNVIFKALPEVMAASMRTVVPGYDSYFEIVPRMGEYMNSVGAVCAEPAYCFTIYHDGEYRDTDIDVEICEAVIEAKKESDKVKFKVIPGAEKAACLIHTGPYETIRESYNELFDQIAAEGWTACQPPRESYIDGIWNKENPAEWTTEVQVPVRKKDS